MPKKSCPSRRTKFQKVRVAVREVGARHPHTYAHRLQQPIKLPAWRITVIYDAGGAA
jgi:hypothetical protein